MQLLEIFDYYNEQIGTYLIEESLTNKEMEELENTLIEIQEKADPTENDVVDNAVLKWLDERNLHLLPYRYDQISMPFKKWE